MFVIANTDLDWFQYLTVNDITKQVNFWTPSFWNKENYKDLNKYKIEFSRYIVKYKYYEDYENPF